MVAIDTNIIVRFLTRDDEEQFQTCRELFSSNEIFIADTVVLETEWVLRFAYDFEPLQICGAFRKLFGQTNVHLSNAQLISQVLDWHEKGLDFADAFHLALSQKHLKMATFDKNFIKLSKSLSNCTVEKP